MIQNVRRILVAATAAIGLAMALSAPAGAAVMLGAPPSTPQTLSTGCGPDPCTLVVTTNPPGTSYVIPSAGVITSWWIDTVNGTAPWQLQTVNEIDVSHFSGGESSSVQTPPPGAVRTFPSRIPATTGQLIGLIGPVSGPVALGAGTPSGAYKETIPPLTDGGAATMSAGGGGGLEPIYGASLEADADHDGYGDETQDACPGDAAKQAGCETITKGPKPKLKTRKRKVKATFDFTASEPIVQCQLDGGAFAACASPYTVKVKRGSHTLEVRTTNAAGLVDPQPANYSWTVKNAKRRRR